MTGAVKFQLGFALLMLVGVGIFYGWMSLKSRSGVAGPCEAAIDCEEGVGVQLCLRDPSGVGFCAKPCTADADCPAGTCQSISVVESSTDSAGVVSQRSYVEAFCHL